MSKRLEIATYANSHGVDEASKAYSVSHSTVERYQRLLNNPETMATGRARTSGPVVGVIGDTHCCFDHPSYPQFLEDTFKAKGVTDIVHIGDLVDNHAISRHVTEPDGMSASEEYEHTLARVAEYTRRFPDVKLCVGNHCRIPARQARELGIPAMFLRDMNETWNLPSTWEVVDDVVIDGVLYKHGIGASGVGGAYNSAIRNRMSVVQGHTHSFAGVQYNANSSSLVFGMSVGCGIDVSAYAFRYGKYIENKPVLGCGIVYNSSHAEFVPMDMEVYGRG